MDGKTRSEGEMCWVEAVSHQILARSAGRSLQRSGLLLSQCIRIEAASARPEIQFSPLPPSQVQLVPIGPLFHFVWNS